MSRFANDLDEQEVLDFLKRNPDFLVRHVENLGNTETPERRLGIGVADFQKHMIKRLRDDIEEARHVTQFLVEHSRDNITGMQRIFHVILELLDCKTFEDAITYILNQMPKELNIDFIAIGIESETTTILPNHNIALLEIGTVDKLLPENTIILESHVKEAPHILYRGHSRHINAHALCPLNLGEHAPRAIVAFASKRPEGFHPEQASDLIYFLTEVMGRTITRWLHEPVFTTRNYE